MTTGLKDLAAALVAVWLLWLLHGGTVRLSQRRSKASPANQKVLVT